MSDKLDLKAQLKQHLTFIYGEDYKNDYLIEMGTLLSKWMNKEQEQTKPLTEDNVYLITYGDSIQTDGEAPLNTLHHFLKEEAEGVISDVHLLPIFPYTSDDGFSVVDYREVNPDFGTWEDIEHFSEDFRLMFDFVANHISKSSEWFQEYLEEDVTYKHYFIEKDEEFDASQVMRPRTSPLFHAYKGKNGERTAWTTFSEDQVDVNFGHFPVLLEITEILLEYMAKGASSIRLDAIGFIWKESGSTCIHLPQAHEIIKLWHTIAAEINPEVQIITETNVPHKENISYFGSGTDEAHMVYQFTLPPLVQYSFATKDAGKLTDWAKAIEKVSDQATYFNFLASHDGIGVRPVEGILNDDELEVLLQKVNQNGGEVSYKSNPDGSQSPYELNINYMDMLKDEGDSLEVLVRKSLAAHSILLSFIGVPAIYYHSFLGSENDRDGLESSDINRRINRKKLEYDRLKTELTENERRSSIFNGMKDMIKVRQSSSAFSPYAEQEILNSDDRIFSLIRSNKETGKKVFFAVNVSDKPVEITGPFSGENLRTQTKVEDTLSLNAYDYVWVKG
ncbi:alpha-amylase family glycosyl hydrolase [Alkalibacterium sp. 20]|uniref:alpha-amylase family glycosyl hydrolase n=1 Tax=Alkalibacterium sp. 20 TaxID=1798803 RepID=UPI0009000C38|nr:alpha-amylase family glycosyl hydrolase [Alkalibacterium sp. 20]OJF91898.1 alpha-amylase [Alkalibacterium sp. 20]